MDYPGVLIFSFDFFGAFFGTSYFIQNYCINFLWVFIFIIIADEIIKILIKYIKISS